MRRVVTPEIERKFLARIRRGRAIGEVLNDADMPKTAIVQALDSRMTFAAAYVKARDAGRVALEKTKR